MILSRWAGALGMGDEDDVPLHPLHHLPILDGGEYPKVEALIFGSGEIELPRGDVGEAPGGERPSRKN
ncbi:hypothetical protein [Candidatus Methanocrinis natronophilus]|uniref:Uncharacterized protein n=1 Tax=Candidatus Methanocrinis natronophilus TaxID=3033396 RepID=A0ABT5X918_9EURY|nr:hypothetical protein [Candidatus Methanocrinis natronophilus]MDF0591186.1 hypothetical protein [Candidatus Methanocrinis natronophilus]